MTPKYGMELVNRTLCDIMDNDLPFGKKIIVLGGDFRQLLPVKKRATRGEMVDLSIKFSSLWRHFKKFSLSQNMRTLPREANFAKGHSRVSMLKVPPNQMKLCINHIKILDKK